MWSIKMLEVNKLYIGVRIGEVVINSEKLV